MSPLEDYQVDRLAVYGWQHPQLTSTNGQPLDHFCFDHAGEAISLQEQSTRLSAIFIFVLTALDRAVRNFR